jgi:hypothetical protein
VKVPAEHRASPSIHFHYFDEEVAEASQSRPLDEKALHALGERWVKQCSEGGVFADFAPTFAPGLHLSAKSREANFKRFDKSRFEALAATAWRKADAVLPQDSLDLCIELVDKSDVFVDQMMHGVAGLTAGAGKIMLKVSVDSKWAQRLPFALAHELHHSYVAAHYAGNGSSAFTLADYLVFEGRADYFAHQLYPVPVAPWDHALTETQFDALWPRVRKLLGSTDFPTMRAVMFGDPGRHIPRWAGYSIGYRLVTQRMKQKPVMDITAMTAAPTAAFIPGESAKADSVK